MWLGKSILAAVFCVSALCPEGAAAQPGIPVSLDAARRAYEASQYAAAVQFLQSAAAADPQDGEIYLLLTKSYIELSQFDAAIQSAERAVLLASQNSQYHQWLGKAYGEKAARASWFSALSLAKKARKEFEIAVKLDERNFAARQDLIEFYCSAPGIVGGGEDKALPHIARLEELDASEGHYARGNCRRQKKDFASADTEFTKALESGAKAPDLIYDIGDYALKQSQPGRLLAVVEAGLKAALSDPRADFYRAAAYILKKEEPAEAERLLRAYLKRAPLRTGYPRPAAAHEWLGRALELQGDPAAARKEYQAALQADPKNKGAHEALKRLDKN
jgi:tetratricopeptide (TPR) repeat protein